MHLFGFIIRIHHDARSSECQKRTRVSVTVYTKPRHWSLDLSHLNCLQFAPNFYMYLMCYLRLSLVSQVPYVREILRTKFCMLILHAHGLHATWPQRTRVEDKERWYLGGGEDSKNKGSLAWLNACCKIFVAMLPVHFLSVLPPATDAHSKALCFVLALNTIMPLFNRNLHARFSLRASMAFIVLLFCC